MIEFVGKSILLEDYKMENEIYNEANGLWYEKQGYYYLPCVELPKQGNKPIGIWGQRHKRYLKQNHEVLYMNLLTSGKLNGYLADINEQAEDMFFRLVKQMAERESVTEQLKSDNQMEWVTLMNNIQSRVAEIVNHDIIYN
jgi:hypothetical protein